MRITKRRWTVLALALIGGCAFAWRPSAPVAADLAKPEANRRVDAARRAALVESYVHLPLSFEANAGQMDNAVKFVSRGSGYTLFLTGEEAVLALRTQDKSEGKEQKAKSKNSGARIGKSQLEILPPPARRSSFADARLPGATNHEQRTTNAVLRLRLAGANPGAMVTGADELPGKTNYFIGNDPKKWRTNVPTYARVRYEGVYPGVDLVYYGNQGQLEYDFLVAPGADPGAIRLDVGAVREPPRAHRDAPLHIAADGDLVVKIGGNELRFHKPVVYQPTTEDRQPRTAVDGHYRVAGKRVSFELGPYDKSRPLVIDPKLTYSTYLGGSSADAGYGIAVDTSGDAYVTGYTESTNFPTTAGSLQTKLGSSYFNAFVTKLNPSGSALVYSTYLGGNASAAGYGIAVDAAGDAYVAGVAYSADFPTTPGAFQQQIAGYQNAFVAKLTPTGSALEYSTYLGGDNYDYASRIAIDSVGHAYVTGYTTSTNFPNTPGVFQNSCSNPSDCQDAFVTEFNPTGTALVYSSFLGGSGGDEGLGIAVDKSGNAYVAGETSSSDFPVTAGVFQSKLAGYQNAFIAKVNSGGSALVYSTYLGGNYYDYANGVALDAAGDAYVAGSTSSSNFPTTPGAFQTVCNACNNSGISNAFVAELNPAGAALVYSTFLGGYGYGYEGGGGIGDGATGVGIDSAGDAYVTGWTPSYNFPTTPDAFELYNGCYFYSDYCEYAFVTELNPGGSSLVYSTYLGNAIYGPDNGTGIAVSPAGKVFLTGYSDDKDFPTTAGAFQTVYGGDGDAFVAMFQPSPNVELSPTSLSFPLQATGTTSPPQTVVLTNIGNLSLGIESVKVAGVDHPDFTETNNCGSSVAINASCNINISFAPQVTGTLNATLDISDNAPGSPQTVSLTGQATAASVSISPSSLTFGTQVVDTTSPAQKLTLTNTGTGSLTITSIVASADFTETNTCPSTVKAGASCTISVSFDPTSGGMLGGCITITDNAPGTPQVVPLTGTGTDIELSPTSLNFGSVTVGTTSPAQTISVENKSTSSVSVTSIAITGADAADFAETNNCGSNLVPGEVCSISVTFSPATTGALSASICVTDNGGASPQTASLTGTGTEN